MNLSDPITALMPTLEGQVLRILARTTAPLTGSRVAQLVSSGSNSGTRTALERLVAQGTVLARRAGQAILYTANRDHLAWPAIECAVQTADSLIDILEARIAALIREYLGEIIAPRVTSALFGSVAQGTSTSESDVDIVVLYPDNVDESTAEDLTENLAEAVELWTGNACNIYMLSDAQLSYMVERHDPVADAWAAEARTFHGPELRRRMRRAS